VAGGEVASTGAERRVFGKAGSKKGKSALAKRPAQPPKCPECTSQRVWKDGLRSTSHGDVQRWLCPSCGLRFSESTELKVKVHVTSQPGETTDPMIDLSDLQPRNVLSLKQRLNDPALPIREDVGSHGVDSPSISTVGKALNTFYPNNRNRRICVSEGETKNLAGVEPRTEKWAAGATETDLKNLLFKYAWYLKKEGYADSTIKSRERLLKILAKRGASLYDPESVKETIARQDGWCNKRKMNAVDAYTTFLRMTNGTWNPPRYKYASRLPFIPTEQELDALIAGCGPKTSTFLRLLKETAMRAGEARSLRWTDIDFERATVRVTPEKGSNPRIFKLSRELLNMLSSLRAKNRVTDPNRIFAKDLKTIRKVFEKQRTTITRKLQNPRLRQIHFHTFRHWKATMLYHQTKDIIYVMRFLGHKRIKNTLIYIQLGEAIFKDEDDAFICKAARTAEEAKPLIEAGFSYECEFDGVKLFKKRK